MATRNDIIWSRFPEYDAFLRKGVAASGGSQTPWHYLAEVFTEQYHIPITFEQLRKRWNRIKTIEQLDANELDPAEDTNYIPELPDELADRFDVLVEKQRTKDADKALARELASAIAGKARWDDFLDVIKSGLARWDRPAPPKIALPKPGLSSPEKFGQLVGDIHIGELVDPLVVGGSFGYSVPIFQERIAQLQERILRLFYLHSHTAPFTSIRLYFLGDGINGVDMRRGQAKAVDVPTATAQTLLLVYAFEQLVRDLSARLGVPIEIIWEFGNHGRVGPFGDNLPADNWDYIAGQILSIALRDLIADGRVKLHADALKYSITDLGPYRVLSQHGDQIKGGDGFSGIPINGLARAYAKSVGLHQMIFDLYFTAHFHTPQDIRTQSGRIIMNGSWTGGDNYSVNDVIAASDPIQIAFGIHPERGMTWKSEIELAPPRKQSPITSFE